MTQGISQPYQREFFTPEGEIVEPVIQLAVVQGDVRESVTTVLATKKPYHDTLNIDGHTYRVTIIRESLPWEIGDHKIQKVKVSIQEWSKKIWVFLVGIDTYQIQAHQDDVDASVSYPVVRGLSFRYITKTDMQNGWPKFGSGYNNITSFSYFRYCLGEKLSKRLKKSIECYIIHSTPTDIESQK
jgi:hypothetical protein